MRTFARRHRSLLSVTAALAGSAALVSSFSANADAPSAAGAATRLTARPPAVAAQATGSITGAARFAGTAPEPAVLQMAADPYCLNAHQGETVTAENLVVNDDGTLRWVFVHIRGAPSGGAAPGESVVLDQVGCVYRPHVFGMRAGATLQVTNSDMTLHNVNVQPANNPGFNVAQPIPKMTTARVFPNPEVMILVRCDVHPWMQAFVGVVDHPFFDVTGDPGMFTIDGVPAGEHVLEAWHETLGTLTATVTVVAGETTTVDFDFSEGQ